MTKEVATGTGEVVIVTRAQGADHGRDHAAAQPAVEGGAPPEEEAGALHAVAAALPGGTPGVAGTKGEEAPGPRLAGLPRDGAALPESVAAAPPAAVAAPNPAPPPALAAAAAVAVPRRPPPLLPALAPAARKSRSSAVHGCRTVLTGKATLRATSMCNRFLNKWLNRKGEAKRREHGGYRVIPRNFSAG